MPGDHVWRLVSPVGLRADRESAVEQPDIGAGLRVAFLSNHKPNADRLHRSIGAALTTRREDVLDVSYHEKPNMARPGPTDLLKRIAQSANVVIVGSAD